MAGRNHSRKKGTVMNRKKYFFTVIFLIPFLIFCQESNGVKIVHPDARDSSYSFIGEWKITETFKLDPQWAADIFDEKEAEAIIGKEIVYRNESAIFQNKEYMTNLLLHMENDLQRKQHNMQLIHLNEIIKKTPLKQQRTTQEQ